MGNTAKPNKAARAVIAGNKEILVWAGIIVTLVAALITVLLPEYLAKGEKICAMVPGPNGAPSGIRDVVQSGDLVTFASCKAQAITNKLTYFAIGCRMKDGDKYAEKKAPSISEPEETGLLDAMPPGDCGWRETNFDKVWNHSGKYLFYIFILTAIVFPFRAAQIHRLKAECEVRAPIPRERIGFVAKRGGKITVSNVIASDLDTIAKADTKGSVDINSGRFK